MRRWILLVSVAVLLCGCGRKNRGSGSMVTQITVAHENAGQDYCRSYGDSESMSLILYGIRNLGQRYTPKQDPDTVEADSYRITLEYANGTQSSYQIKEDRYIRVGQQPWQETNPTELGALHDLLEMLLVQNA